MRVGEVRNRVVDRLAAATASGSEDAATEVSNFCRAVLIALASQDANSEVDLEKLAIKTATAGRILGLNQEYVRELIRRKALDATKSNGEFQIPLSSVVSFQAKSVKFSSSPVPLDMGKWLEVKIGPGIGFRPLHKPHHHGPQEQSA